MNQNLFQEPNREFQEPNPFQEPNREFEEPNRDFQEPKPNSLLADFYAYFSQDINKCVQVTS